jgi:membrane-bound lytic murein transglycosylase A
MPFTSSHVKIFGASFILIFLLSCAYQGLPTQREPVNKDSVYRDLERPPSTETSPPSNATSSIDFSFSSKSRFRPIGWSQLPGFENTPTSKIWSDLLENCAKPHPLWLSLCKEMRPLTLADEQDQRMWLLSQLQPFRVETQEGQDVGMLTSYFEPTFRASLSQRDTFNYPIFSPPPSLLSAKKRGEPWFNRKDIETLPVVQAELQNQAIAWLEDPIDVMIVHVQGSARLRVEHSPAQFSDYRLSFAASNDLPYQSMAKWILDQGLGKDTSWQGIKSTLEKNPQSAKEAFWSNPRYIFFSLSTLNNPNSGPQGSWGIPLKSNLSIAVDPKSIPLGMPLWLESEGSTPMRQMVLSQDTGNAINGAIRADYFAGTGPLAGEFANKIKQNLKLWLILPRRFNP